MVAAAEEDEVPKDAGRSAAVKAPLLPELEREREEMAPLEVEMIVVVLVVLTACEEDVATAIPALWPLLLLLPLPLMLLLLVGIRMNETAEDVAVEETAYEEEEEDVADAPEKEEEGGAGDAVLQMYKTPLPPRPAPPSSPPLCRRRTTMTLPG